VGAGVGGGGAGAAIFRPRNKIKWVGALLSAKEDASFHCGGFAYESLPKMN